MAHLINLCIIEMKVGGTMNKSEIQKTLDLKTKELEELWGSL